MKFFRIIALLLLVAVARAQSPTFTGDVNVLQFGAKADGTDQTAKVQAAANYLGANGGIVAIPRAVKFRKEGLVITNSTVLRIYGGGDISTQVGTTLLSGEYVIAPYGVNALGAVNEVRVEAPFHPGIVNNVNKGDPSQNTVYGPSQTTNNPAKASYIIQDEGNDVYLTQYVSYPDTNGISGVQTYMFWDEFTLTGVSAASFTTTAPVAGEVITGVISGATGYYLPHQSVGNLVLHWISGNFVVGETLRDLDETTTATISGIARAQKYNDGFFMDRDRGGQMVIGARKAPFPLTIAGAVGLEGSIDFGQARFGGQSWIKPTLVWGGNLNLTTNPKLWMDYDDTVVPARFRISGTNVAIIVGASNAYQNLQGWSQLLQIHSTTNGAALSLVDHGNSGDQWDIASYFGRFLIARGTNTSSVDISANHNVKFAGGIGVGSIGDDPGASNVVVHGGVKVREGLANSTMGVVALTAGAVTVNTTMVTANSRIFLTGQTGGGTPGAYRVNQRTGGSSFEIASTSGTDTNLVAWWIVEPAP